MAFPIRLNAPSLSPLERSPMQKLSIEEPQTSFGDVFKKALNDTDQLQGDAQNLIASYLRGDPVELHQVMAASEEASISLELLVEVRNKLTDAYRSIMNVQ
jgi:flagellar hook-basal body complex protein FliE